MFLVQDDIAIAVKLIDAQSTGLRLAQGIADRKSTMPMLANVLLRTQGKNQLLVAATDLNVSRPVITGRRRARA